MLYLIVKHAAQEYRYSVSMDLAERIKQLRQAHGMTQEQLAKRCGVTKSAVSQWETGSTANIKPQVFLRLCEALHTDPHYLIFGPARGDSPTERQSGHG